MPKAGAHRRARRRRALLQCLPGEEEQADDEEWRQRNAHAVSRMPRLGMSHSPA